MDDLFKKAEEHFNKGEFDEAASILEPLCQQENIALQALMLSAHVAQSQKSYFKAQDYIKRALALSPNNSGAHYLAAIIYAKSDDVGNSIKEYEAVIALQPDHFRSLCNLGLALTKRGSLSKAAELYKRALTVNPDDETTKINLGFNMFYQGKSRDAVKYWRKAFEESPDNLTILINILLGMHYDTNITSEEIFLEHKKLGEKLAVKFQGEAEKIRLDSDFDKRKIRVGYLSQDFRTHSVAYFLEGILYSHDRSRFEIFCYSNSRTCDDTTMRFKGFDSIWRDTADFTDEELDACIRKDKIDILVDLGGCTCPRIQIFARRPAPVQVTYLGYVNTTGLKTMDYLFSDEIADPPGSERFHSEKIARLKGCSLCYAPLVDAIEPAIPPALKNGYMTFGSFNNYAKMNDEVIETWVEILKTAPNSRLIIKNKSMNDNGVRIAICEQFKQLGIESDRVELLGYAHTPVSHMSIYNYIDVALDTFPFNGVTTTCESLWMGVPVITLMGDRYSSRIAASILTAVSMKPFIAQSRKEYVAKAVFQTQNLEMLSQLRKNLRPLMASSNLCDIQGTTAQIEEFYISFLKERRDFGG